MENLKKLALSKPEKCEKCEGKLDYLGLGQYKCKECGNQMLDNYGKIQKYYQEHGQAPIFQVARETGISRESIHIILDDNTQNKRKLHLEQSSSRDTDSRNKMHFLKNR